MRSWPWQRGGPRTTGTPPSANGASSLHLRWDLDGSWRSVSVDLTVEAAPSVPRLYFWALQADFATPRDSPAGGAHLGLQWHPGHPGCRAVNWGGYRTGGGELDGSGSPLPSAMLNPNTRDFSWEPNRTYRLTIARVEEADRPDGSTAWRASVTDLSGGTTTDVRDLFIHADRINGALVWSEVFARCDDPAVQVRWSDPEVVDLRGATTFPRRASVNYQSHVEGGCANTCSWAGEHGVHQRTNATRNVKQGTMLPWPR